MKFATKPIQHYPPHLTQIATLPWEIKKSICVDIQHADMKKMHTKCILSAQILIPLCV